MNSSWVTPQSWTRRRSGISLSSSLHRVVAGVETRDRHARSGRPVIPNRSRLRMAERSTPERVAEIDLPACVAPTVDVRLGHVGEGVWVRQTPLPAILIRADRRPWKGDATYFQRACASSGYPGGETAE